MNFANMTSPETPLLFQMLTEKPKDLNVELYLLYAHQFLVSLKDS